MNEEERRRASKEEDGNNVGQEGIEMGTLSSSSATHQQQAQPPPPPSSREEGTSSKRLFAAAVKSATNAASTNPPPPPLLKAATLLGSDELSKHLQDRQAVFQVTTWNMGSLPLPDEQQLRKIFYHDDGQHCSNNSYNHGGGGGAVGGGNCGDMMTIQNVDIHVVSIQECWPDADELELQMQMCLCPQYALFHSVNFGTLHVSVFIRRDLLWYTTECSEISQTLRSGRLFKTKGFVGVAFGLFGSRFLFINAHLSAGDDPERASQRADELKRVISLCKGTSKLNSSSSISGTGKRSKSNSVSSSSSPSSSSSSYDAIFLCGDLNFRISKLSRERILDELKTDNLDALLREDQLRKLLFQAEMTKSALNGFQEAATITFRPTYKYDLGTDNFDSSSKKRSPAYTDRIIFQSKKLPTTNEPLVTCLSYESVKDLKTSDHRPVYAVFSVIVKPGFDTLPLTGAQFKREVFIKAIQQRAKFLLDRRKKIASSACSLM